MKLSNQATTSSGNLPSWPEITVKKVKERRQRVYNSIKERDQFRNLSMEMVLDNTNIQRVFRVFFEEQKVTLFNQSFANFWELGLQTQKIINYKFEDWNINPPQMLDDLEELSDFPLCIERSLIGEKPLKIVLPFIPKFIHYKEVSRLYILDNTEAWYTGESLVLDKVPMSDVFTFKQCFIIKALSDSKVLVQFKWFVDFHKWTPLKGTVISSTQEETDIYSTKFFIPALKDALKTGTFIPLENDIFRPKALVKEIQEPQLREANVKDLKVEVKNSSLKHHTKEVIAEALAIQIEKDKSETVDPLDEPISLLLKEIQERNQQAAVSETILQRLYCPKYKGDYIFIIMIIISLANLSRVLFF